MPVSLSDRSNVSKIVQVWVYTALIKSGFYCPWVSEDVVKSQSTRGSKTCGNGPKQPYLKLCLLKTSHEQVIKSTLFCLLILMWSRDRQFKFVPPGNNFGSKHFLKITNFACLLSKQTLANRKSNEVSFLN